MMQLGWNTNLDSANCTMTAAGIALDRQTLGHVRASPPEMRAAQDDQSEGTSLRDAAVAWKRYANEHLTTYDIGKPIQYQEFKQRIIDGHGAMLAGCYDVMYPGYACANSFRGGHCIYINEYRQGSYLVYDPLCNRPKWIPEEIVFRYGTKYASFTTAQQNNTNGCASIHVRPRQWSGLGNMYAAFTATEAKAFERWNGRPYDTDGPCHGKPLDCNDGHATVCARGHLHCVKLANIPPGGEWDGSQDEGAPKYTQEQAFSNITASTLVVGLAVVGIALAGVLILMQMQRSRGVAPSA